MAKTIVISQKQCIIWLDVGQIGAKWGKFPIMHQKIADLRWFKRAVSGVALCF